MRFIQLGNNKKIEGYEILDKCFVCGSCTGFLCEEGITLREANCPACGASRRNSDVARAIVNTLLQIDDSLNIALTNLGNYDIYEAQSNGPINNQLSSLPKYKCSEYFFDVTPGSLNEAGIRCEDLQNLSFSSNSFDLVITQDVFEHIADPEKAFSEIRRVLKPGGYHIFTVPFHEGKKSLKRAKIENGKGVYLLPRVYHIDPLRKDGGLVYTDFGEDLIESLDSLGYETDNIFSSKWYESEEIPYIEDETSHKIYQIFYEKEDLLRYFKYNSIVFRSKNVNGRIKEGSLLKNTGERYLPFVDPTTTGAEIHYEHLHRYAFASNFTKGKCVLDLASGEGYGSYLISDEAASVVGIEIDEDVIEHSRAKYHRENLEFRQGSILEVPIDGGKIFDVIVCFEAIEHVEDHERLLSEVKRLLKDDGFLIISTPNKNMYSDNSNYTNPFHLKELNFDDFTHLLACYFSYNYLYGQQVITGSNIWRLLSNGVKYCDEFMVEIEDGSFVFKNEIDKIPMYFISISSNLQLGETVNKTSFLIDKSNMLNAQRDAQRDAQISSLFGQLQKSNAHASSLQQEISDMKKSVIWQLTMKFHDSVVERAMPQDTRRRRWYDLGLKGGRIFINDGPKQAMWEFKEKMQNQEIFNFEDKNKTIETSDVGLVYRQYINDLLDRADEKSAEYVPLLENGINLTTDDIKIIAFYLPQYHPIPENNEWWGKGFTDWTNVSKAVPQFVGHYQPHLPDELGFYDLRLIEIQKRQIELAKQYGIFGFCFHYYWFNGKRLLEKPLNQFLNNPELNFPFCICWANENWTRRWDGMENEILISQTHSPENDIAFIEGLIPFFNDPRYIKIDNRPVLIVYRAPLLPDAKATTDQWRAYCRKKGISDPYLIMAQTFGFKEPRAFGFDAAVEFPPHTMPGCPQINRKINVINPKFKGDIWDYDRFVKSKQYLKKVPYKLFKAVMPGWDNTARMPNKASIFHGSNPVNYREWLWNVAEWTAEVHQPQERIVFINAMNEWAEGAHLEPDRKYGYGYLQATLEVVKEYHEKFVGK